MRKLQLVFLSLFLFCSCAQVYFANPQPIKGTKIKTFIPDIQGNYFDSLIDISIFKNEIVVAGYHYQITSKNPVENEVLVKYYKDYYFVSFSDSAYFSVFMAKFYDTKLALYMLNADTYSQSKLQRLVNVEKVNEEKNWYLIDPSKKEFDEILDFGLFEVVNVLERR